MNRQLSDRLAAPDVDNLSYDFSIYRDILGYLRTYALTKQQMYDNCKLRVDLNEK